MWKVRNSQVIRRFAIAAAIGSGIVPFAGCAGSVGNPASASAASSGVATTAAPRYFCSVELGRVLPSFGVQPDDVNAAIAQACVSEEPPRYFCSVELGRVLPSFGVQPDDVNAAIAQACGDESLSK